MVSTHKNKGDDTTGSSSPRNATSKAYTRGVNLGGWLVQERWLSPYQFALTDCHIRGDLCWYEGQTGAPINAPICNITECKPLRWNEDYPDLDFPKDESTLVEAFDKPEYAERWFNAHFDNYLTKDDLVKIKESGMMAVRVPLPHWILGDIGQQEDWARSMNRWKYFTRMCEWCREIGLEVWPNIHTAPGSQNGFDNSGIAKLEPSCYGWDETASHVRRSLDVVAEITGKIVEEGLSDVVQGFGLLNEPFYDCHLGLYKRFAQDGLNLVRANMGLDVQVFVSDMFQAQRFNDGKWWLDPTEYENTMLDSHYYHIFNPAFREMSPRQHIGYTCLPEPQIDGIQSCCYEDGPYNNAIPSRGVQRIVTEWTAVYDRDPGPMLEEILDGIAINGTAPYIDRQLSQPRKDMLHNFIQAQIVSYEVADIGFGKGWFFWTFKTEGGAYAEWDFLRAYEEGWFPPIVRDPEVPSQDVYGTCEDILLRTDDSMNAIEPYPPNPQTDDAIVFDDDLVQTHGQSLLMHVPHQDEIRTASRSTLPVVIPCILLVVAALVAWGVVRGRKKASYTDLSGSGKEATEATPLNV
jgi:glucan 1,3-beta-glucosidase